MAVINIVLDGFIFVIMAVLSISILISNREALHQEEDSSLVYVSALTGIAAEVNALIWHYNGNPNYILLNTIICAVYYILGFFVSMAFGRYAFAIAEHKGIPTKTYRKCIYGIALVGILLVLISLIGDYYFYIDAAGYYHRGPLFLLNQSLAVIQMLLIGAFVTRNRKELGSRHFISILSYLLFPLLSVIIQLFIIDISLLYPSIALSVVLLFSLSYLEEKRDYEQALTQNRIDSVIAQFNPHFLYNSLTSIYYLIAKDPQLAKSALSDFTLFLRGNMDSMSSMTPIPFRKENEFLQAYLSLEKLRYGTRLTILQDLQAEDFLLPALTIQTLAEISINQGITPRKEGGILTITTKESEQEYLAIVSDNGLGFNPKSFYGKDSGGIGTEHIDFLLHQMCDGWLEIASALDEGTTFTVHIPKVKEESNHIQ